MSAPGETAAAVNPEAAAFVSRLPQLEERIGGMVLGPHSTWQATPESPDDGVIGIVHASVTREGGEQRTLTVSGWYGRSEKTGDVIARYGMRVLGEGALVNWTSGITKPGDVRFRNPNPEAEQPYMPADFTAAHALADLLPGAVPITPTIADLAAALPKRRGLAERVLEYFETYHVALGAAAMPGRYPSNWRRHP